MTRRIRKSLIGILVISITLLGNIVAVHADDDRSFSLIEYCEEHQINTQEEFNYVLTTYCGISSEFLDYDTDYEYFCVDVDQENDCVVVIKMEKISATREQTVSNSAKKNYFDSNGNKIFTIRVEGTFMFTIGWCACTSSSGSFTKPFLSPWNSTPTISSGNTSATKAYALISGTATALGLSRSYTLTLTCDNTGHFECY